MAATFQIYERKDQRFGWRLTSANGEIIAVGGEGFTTKQSAKTSIETVQRAAESARVVEDE